MTVLEHVGRIARGEAPPPGIATLLSFEARVTDDQGRLVAFATSTLMTLRGEQAAGR